MPNIYQVYCGLSCPSNRVVREHIEARGSLGMEIDIFEFYTHLLTLDTSLFFHEIKNGYLHILIRNGRVGVLPNGEYCIVTQPQQTDFETVYKTFAVLINNYMTGGVNDSPPVNEHLKSLIILPYVKLKMNAF